VEIVALTSDRYPAWDDFCARSDDAWFWHTTAWLDYQLRCRPEASGESLAFMVTEGSSVAAVVPLMLVERNYGPLRVREIAAGSEICWAPALAGDLSPPGRARALEAVFARVDELARDRDAARASFKQSPLAPSFWGSAPRVPDDLSRFGYADVSLATQVLDLGEPAARLWRAMSENHRRNVTRGARSLAVVAFDSGQAALDVFEEYRTMHHRAAGRVTRPLVTFRIMYDWIEQGHGVLFAARQGGRFVGFVYVMRYKDGAFYGSGANDPDCREPIGHVLHWEAIRWLGANGSRRYEMGTQRFSALPHDAPSEKELNIARFKRGFGGVTVPLPIREKYYSAELYRHVSAERGAAFLEHLGRGAVPA